MKNFLATLSVLSPYCVDRYRRILLLYYNIGIFLILVRNLVLAIKVISPRHDNRPAELQLLLVCHNLSSGQLSAYLPLQQQPCWQTPGTPEECLQGILQAFLEFVNILLSCSFRLEVWKVQCEVGWQPGIMPDHQEKGTLLGRGMGTIIVSVH